MSVDSTHPEYAANVDRWELVRSVIRSDATRYIKDIDPNDPSRNTQYKDDAILTNFTLRTRNALVGSVFRKESIEDFNGTIGYVVDDSTGNNRTLEQVAQEAIGDVLEVGRYGILVDYPAAEDGLTAQEVSDRDLKARMYPYSAESIINWNVEKVNGKCVLMFVVLREFIDKLDDDGFSWVQTVQYRVLKLEDNAYVQYLYDDEANIIEVMNPRKADGTSFDFIPFVIMGSEDNDWKVDNAPMYDLSTINIGHLKNSADYEESVHITGQPTLFISSAFAHEEFMQANPNGVKIGARAGHNLGEGGSATMLQASPNQLADEAMKRKEEQAVMIGARLITQTSGVETAEAVRLRFSSDSSVLAIIVNNVNAGLILALQYISLFMGAEEEFEYIINREFYDTTIDPQLLMAQIQLLDRGIIANEDVRSYVRKGGIIDADRTDDDIDSDVGNSNPLVDSTLDE